MIDSLPTLQKLLHVAELRTLVKHAKFLTTRWTTGILENQQISRELPSKARNFGWGDNNLARGQWGHPAPQCSVTMAPIEPKPIPTSFAFFIWPAWVSPKCQFCQRHWPSSMTRLLYLIPLLCLCYAKEPTRDAKLCKFSWILNKFKVFSMNIFFSILVQCGDFSKWSMWRRKQKRNLLYKVRLEQDWKCFQSMTALNKIYI